MFNKRSFVLGLGVGIVVGALLLQLFMLGESSQNKLSEREQELRQGELQGQQPSSSEPLPDVSAAADDDGQQSPEETPEQPPEASALDEEASGLPLADAGASETVEIQEPVLKLVRIEPGFNLTETSELLLASGIIDDAPEFIKQMKAKNKQARAGYFLIQENAGIDGAIKGVTGKPISKSEAEAWIAAQ